MANPIEFYFDFSSPYAYLAATRIDDLASHYGRTVKWRPMLLGAAMKETGQRPLLEIPIKGEYTKHDVARFARLLNLKFRMPAVFPFAAVSPSRAFYWLDARDPSLAKRFAKAVFRQAFTDGRDVTSLDFVCDLAQGMGVDREALKAGITSPEGKERLRAEVEAAVNRGVFGSPFIYVDGEPFWGADRLAQVEEWLVTGGW
ncbi:MAG: 2-hydroxychromene-2-carboxylate isomerase [Tagaea sp.]|jgi:2-hydroxychromene-2-carboxylate isomerase|nr:2-hydroxychromene-2-carboxylate isomerase [Magnetospirillum sp.]